MQPIRFCVPKRIDPKGLFSDASSTSIDVSAADSVALKFDAEDYCSRFGEVRDLVADGSFHEPEDHWLALGVSERQWPGRYRLLPNERFQAYNEKLDAWGRLRPVNIRFFLSVSPEDAGAPLAFDGFARQSVGFFDLVLVTPGENDIGAVRALADDAGLGSKVVKIVDSGQFHDVFLPLASAQGVTHIAFLDQANRIGADAVFDFACFAERNGGAQVVYLDEGYLREERQRPVTFRKPAWSSEYFLATAYSCGLTYFKRDFVCSHGEQALAENPSLLEYFLTFAALKANVEFAHLAEVSTWNVGAAENSQNASAIVDAVERYVAALLPAAQLARSDQLYMPAVIRSGAGPISIVIPSADRDAIKDGERTNILDACIASMRRSDQDIQKQIIVVHNDDMSAARQSALRLAGVTLVQFNEPAFNFSRKINMGAAKADAELLLLLNDDVLATSPAWLHPPLALLGMPGVAAVGPRLVFPDGKVQHCGCSFFRHGPYHPYYGADLRVTRSYAGMAYSIRNVASVTAACMLTRRAVFEQVGGFEEALFDLYNDADYCLKLRKIGQRAVYDGRVELMHMESVSLDPSRVHGNQQELFEARWGAPWDLDPYYNRRISAFEPYRWRHPPHVGREWMEMAVEPDNPPETRAS